MTVFGAVTQILAMPVPPPASDAMAVSFLSSREHSLMAKYRHAGRRSEFVAGRVALKRALLESQGSAIRICRADSLSDAILPMTGAIQALPDESGRPRLWIDEAITSDSVSIAHAGGWAVAARSDQPVGVDIVDTDANAAIPADLPWLQDVPEAWLPRLRALLWGLRESLLKTGASPASTIWDLDGLDALPACSAAELVAGWPIAGSMFPFDIKLGETVIAGAFLPLTPSLILVVVSMPSSLGQNQVPHHE